MGANKQGIVSILGSGGEIPAAPKGGSLRRTLSADMSSKKWQSENGFSSPMKKIASFAKFPIAGADSDEEDDREEQSDDIWASIQKEKNEKPRNLDIWSSIVSQKEQEDASKSLPPYIHPLVKRSKSSLSERSLEICTESLGSETGSDGFSSYPTSETGDSDKEEEQEQRKQQSPIEYDEIRVVKYNNAAKKSPQRSFPPPISSLSLNNGASVRMTTRRDNGRLVLEAVSVPSHNNFQAQRQDGRLVLTFTNTKFAREDVSNEEVNELDEISEEFGNFGEELKTGDYEEEDLEEEEEEMENRGFVGYQAHKIPTGAINVHRLAQMVNKPIGLTNRNPTWPNKFNETVKLGQEEKKIDPAPALAQSLPPRPPGARLVGGAAASLNAYEYFWRPKPMSMASSGLKPNPQHQNPTKNQEAKDWGNHKNPIPLINSCKEPRRSLLSWEAHCIAT